MALNLFSNGSEILVLVAVLLLACTGGLLWLRQRKRREAEKAAALQLSKVEQSALRLYRQGKFEAACSEFRSAAALASQSAESARSLRNRHHALVSRSKLGGIQNLLAAHEGMQSLLNSLAESELCQLARQNLRRMETVLRAAVAKELARANECYDKNDLAQLLPVFVSSARVAIHLKDAHLQTTVYQQFASWQLATGQIEEAEKTLIRVRKIAQSCVEDAPQLAADIADTELLLKSRKNESLVRKTLDRVKYFLHQHKLQEADELAGEAVAQAHELLRADHWMTADALNHRACAKVKQGFYGEARRDFEDALVILEEWPEQSADLVELVQNNLDKCRRDMGF